MKFLLVWRIAIFVFFSLSEGKRPRYILSLYPALALLVGYLGDRALACWDDRFYRKAVIIPSLIFLAILALLTVGSPVGTGLFFKPMFGMSLVIGVVTAAAG